VAVAVVEPLHKMVLVLAVLVVLAAYYFSTKEKINV
jgi:hypothetical protein